MIKAYKLLSVIIHSKKQKAYTRKGAGSMPLLKEKIYTVDDLCNLPDGERAELIHGQLYMMAPPSYLHQTLSMEIAGTIRDYIRRKKGKCQVLSAPLAVNLNADDKVYVEPDISVICDRNKITDRGIQGAPDLIVEIVSPSSRKMDYSTKNALYADAGVREYWIVDPLKKRTTVYYYEEDAAPMIVAFDQPLTVSIYGDLQITISNLLQEFGI